MKPKNDTGPAKRHVDPFTAAQKGAVRTEQRQQAERGRAEECQPNARDLRRGLIPGLADEIGRELAKTSALRRIPRLLCRSLPRLRRTRSAPAPPTPSGAAHGHQSLWSLRPRGTLLRV